MKQSAFDRVKRGIDVTAAGVGLVASAPLQVAIAALVRKKLGSPVLFRQERPGKDGKLFTLVKFRTMLDLDNDRGLVSDAERLTATGATLRSTSLDELPTLWNVFKGDMSLVGPRPLLPSYLDLYDARQQRRHEIRPGITGLAQVNGRNSLNWPERLELDVQYVDRRSLLLDMYILRQTIRAVLSRSGVSDANSPTMTPFNGKKRGADRT